MILSCNCEHKGQDEIHGKNRRVMNPTKSTIGSKVVFRCTVCKKERTE